MKASPLFFLAAIVIEAPHMSLGESSVLEVIALVLGFLAIWRES
jgi:hypothetical protein